MQEIRIRVAPEVDARWRDLYAATYPEHRLSLNRWLIALIERGLQAPAAKSVRKR